MRPAPSWPLLLMDRVAPAPPPPPTLYNLCDCALLQNDNTKHSEGMRNRSKCPKHVVALKSLNMRFCFRY